MNRRLLIAIAAAVCVVGIGVAVAAFVAPGSGGGNAPSKPTAHATAARGRGDSSAPDHASGRGGVSAAELARRYQRQRERRQAATRRQVRRARHASPTALPPATRGPGALGHVSGDRTSCTNVVHIGDSTSEGLDSATYLPKRSQRIGSQYARVGAGNWQPEITGATSIVETLPGGTNAYEVARGLIKQGYRGCWVIALGTNDTADVAAGSTVALPTRIARMMSVIGKQPVMWVNVKTLVSSGPYAEGNMLKWNRALVQACPRYPNMRVFDWASVVKDGWYIPDGIHFTSAGYAARARLIADGLAKAFPARGTSLSCVVR